MSALSVRRPLSVLAVLAMVATLLFAVAGTSSAADPIKPNSPATFSACPDNADIPDAGFTDIPTGSFFDDAVNCLAYYATTLGTTPTTYGPADNVTRAQMAVFLYRMAPEAGVVLSATPPDAGFTDISELSAEAQLAINALAAKGVIKGKTTTTYAPADTVWRQQMALFLTRFSDKATAPVHGPGGYQAKETDTGANLNSKNNFTDLGNTTVEASKAINEVFHLGVASGTTATTYDPLGNVNRGQMSLFLTRLAAQMNVRPAGVNIQAAPTSGNDIVPFADELTSDIAVTARTTAFMPAANTVVDVFRFPSVAGVPASAFNANGTCIPANVFQYPLGATACLLEVADTTADGDGNAVLTDLVTAPGATNVLYAWTGATAAKFDADTTTYSMVSVATSAVADGYTFELDGTNADAIYKFGATATWVIQVTDNDKPIAEAGWEFTLDTLQDVDGVTQGQTGLKMKTDANGQIVITKSFADPSSTATNYATFEGTVTNWNTSGGIDAGVNALEARWEDTAQLATKVTLSTPTAWAIVNNPAPTSNSATALVTDQYGNPMSGVDVLIDSNQVTGLNAGNTVGTASDGKASIAYNWTVITDGKEVITADPVGAAPPATVTVDFYWVFKAATGDKTFTVSENINAREVANKMFVATSDAATSPYAEWTWKTGDTFKVSGILKSQADFETAIAKKTGTVYTYLNINVLQYSTTGFSEFDLLP